MRNFSVYLPHLPVEVTSVWFRLGSAQDPTNKKGLSHLLEHLLLSKTKKFRTKIERFTFLEQRGFEYNASTSLETLHLFIQHLPGFSKEASELLLEGIQESEFSASDFKQEKSAILSEISESYNDPYKHLWGLANSGLWPDFYYDTNTLGSIESVSSLTLADVEKQRNQLLESEKYSISLLSTNSPQPTSVKKALRARNVFSQVDLPKLRHFTEEVREGSQNVLSFSFRIPGVQARADIKKLEFIQYYLANSWTSRLIQRLRLEKGYCYWVYSGLASYSQSGAIRFTLSTEPKTVSKVLSVFVEEIVRLKEILIPNEDIERTKKMMKTRLLQQSLDLSSLLWWYGWDAVMLGETESIPEYLKTVERFTAENIQMIAKKHLIFENFSLASIGPKIENVGKLLTNAQKIDG